MSDTYDAVVAGAGPAGSSAARGLALQGLSVALVDKAVFPRPKLCGGLLTWKTLQALAAGFELGLDDLDRAGVVLQTARDWAILFRGREVGRGRSPHAFVLVDRAGLDHLLVQRAREAGAVLVEGAHLIHSSPETAEVATTDDRVFQGRVLIGCDGVTSRVRRSLPLTGKDRRAWNRGMARAVEVRLPRDAAPAALRDLDHPRLFLGHVRAGYGWVFPHRDDLVIGLCGLADPRRAFKDSVRDMFEGVGLDPDGVDLGGHPLPYGNYMARPGFGRTLLCGDAAGLVEPTLGEGIFYALQSGRHAARAAGQALALDPKNPDPLPYYLDRLHRDVLPELAASNRLRWTLLGLIQTLGAWPLRFFLALPGARLAEMVHGLRSFSRLRPKEWDF